MPYQSFADQTGHYVNVSIAPQRIISLVPSQTELFYDLKLEAQIVGITRYCVPPTHWRQQKAIIGGTKNFDFQVIEKLAPDLIVGNREENYKEGIERLMEKFPVYISDVYSLQDALVMIRSLGTITNRDNEASDLINRIQHNFGSLKKVFPQRVLYMIWRKPWMAAGSNTFINSMLGLLGLENCIADRQRYPELTEESLRELKPDYIFLSSEPFPFGEKHVREIQLICPGSKILLVDGEMFSWYGSRLLKAPDYFNSLPLDQ
jgi:ABC-type Fe3+-hydroxamate transport system substrate-binding protein